MTGRVGDERESVLAMLTSFRQHQHNGHRSPHKPLLMLLALGRLATTDSSRVPWAVAEYALADLIAEFGPPSTTGRATVQRYGRPGEGDRVYYPVAALYGAGLWELDTDSGTVPNAHGSSVPQRWFDEHQPRNGLVSPVYELVRDSAEARAAAVRALVETYFVDADHTALLDELGLPGPEASSPAEAAFSSRAAEYRRLCDRVDVFWTGRDSTRADRTSAAPVRSADARRAVLLRSEGRCENPNCTGDIHDLTDGGDPILEIDHIHDLAQGGPDHPVQMIALCPNCHAIKTRGSTREQLRAVLLVVSKERHSALMAGTGHGTS